MYDFLSRGRFLPVLLSVLFLSPLAASEPDPGPNDPAGKASVSSVPRKRIEKISQRIDELVDQKLKSASQQRNPIASDEIFLRRVYLDIAGRIPSLQETRKFLADKDSEKRAKLIDQLLDSYAYTSRQFNFWADLLRIKSNMPGGLTGVPYVEFVKNSLEQNKPYDELVRELLSSEGANLERDNGAVGYYLRDRNMPEDNMSNTIRVFLGTRLECAQCHDHPFDKWTQRQYFEMVAFTGGMSYRADGNNKTYQQIRKQFNNKEIPEKLRPILNRLSQAVRHGVEGGGTGLARLPENFLGDDGYDGEVIVAREMFEGQALTPAKVPDVAKKQKPKRRGNRQQAAIPGAKDINSREIYAQWLTDPENPRFAKVIANRLWKQAFGLGLIEPVDIIEDSTVASNPELMDYLTETMVELDFDMKQFLRAIYNSETYQAEAFASDITDPQQFGFNGPKVRRMSAEQLWDSLLVLTVPNTDQRDEDESKDRQYGDQYEMYEKLVDANVDDVIEMAQEIADRRKNKGKTSYKDDPAYKALQKKRQAIQQSIKQANKRRDVAAVRKLKVDLAKLTNEYRRERNADQYQRASEIQSPAPAGHFLREFGQSDREVIDNANTEPAVTQVLSMMNGYVEERIARDQNSVLMQAGLKSTSAQECTSAVFLSMLNREPSSQEVRVWKREFDAAFRAREPERVKEIFTDLVWTLANSNEFIFIK